MNRRNQHARVRPTSQFSVGSLADQPLNSELKRARTLRVIQWSVRGQSHPVVCAANMLQGSKRRLQLDTRGTGLPSSGQALRVHTLRLGVTPAGIRVIQRAQRQSLAHVRTTRSDVVLGKLNARLRDEGGGQLLQIRCFHGRQRRDGGLDLRASVWVITRGRLAERVLHFAQSQLPGAEHRSSRGACPAQAVARRLLDRHAPIAAARSPDHRG